MKKIIIFISVALMLVGCIGYSPTFSSLVDNMQGGQTDLTGTWSSGCKIGAPDESQTHTYNGTQMTVIQVGYATSDGTCGGATVELGTFTADYTISPSVTASGGWNQAVTPFAQDGVTRLPNFPTLAHLTVSNQVSTGTFANLTPPSDIYWAVDASVPNAPVYYSVTGSFTVDAAALFMKQ